MVEERIAAAAGRECRRRLRCRVRRVVEQVVRSCRDDVTDAAARVWHVAVEAGDNVHVQVEHGLTARGADVDADVEAVGDLRVQAAEDRVARDCDGGSQLGLLGGRGVEPGGDVAARDEERVRGGDGEGVPEGEGERAFVKGAVLRGRTEWADRVRHLRNRVIGGKTAAGIALPHDLVRCGSGVCHAHDTSIKSCHARAPYVLFAAPTPAPGGNGWSDRS